jgi:hypothetical protein
MRLRRGFRARSGEGGVGRRVCGFITAVPIIKRGGRRVGRKRGRNGGGILWDEREGSSF